QQIQVDAREAVEVPVGRGGVDGRIDAGFIRQHEANEILGELARARILFDLRPRHPVRRESCVIPVAGKIDLVEKLERGLACLAPGRFAHARLPAARTRSIASSVSTTVTTAS